MSVITFLPLVVALGGFYFLVKLRGFFFIHPKLVAKEIFTELKKPRAFSSLMLALAGTLGVGNIVGVAVGISIGGYGSVFWLLFSSLFSSIIKYCEVAIATDKSANGMSEVIEASFKRRGKPLAKLYTALCLCLSLTMGTALQSKSIAEAAELSLGIKGEQLLIPMLFFLLFFIFGGASLIEKGVKYIIPLTTIVYGTMCLCIIFPNLGRLPSVISLIFESAFNSRSAYGGILGFLTSTALKEGFARGMLSNEAGAGTSALAHSRAEERSAFTGGLFGMLEVFFDTVVLCPLTAFAILLSGINTQEVTGAQAVIQSFASGVIAGDVLTFVCILFFALSTILCWYYYGGFCCESLFGSKSKGIFVVLFISACALGLFFSSGMLIYASDILLFLMTLITLSTLFKNSGRLSELTDTFIKNARAARLALAHNDRSDKIKGKHL